MKYSHYFKYNTNQPCLKLELKIYYINNISLNVHTGQNARILNLQNTFLNFTLNFYFNLYLLLNDQYHKIEIFLFLISLSFSKIVFLLVSSIYTPVSKRPNVREIAKQFDFTNFSINKITEIYSKYSFRNVVKCCKTFP